MTVQQEINLLKIEIQKYESLGLKFTAMFCRWQIEFLEGKSELQKMKYIQGTTKVPGHYIKDFTGSQSKISFHE